MPYVNAYIDRKVTISEQASTSVTYLDDWSNAITYAQSYFGSLHDPDFPNLVCNNVQIEPKDPPIFSVAIVTLSFGKPPAGPEGGEISLGISAETLSLPDGSWKWTSGSKSGDVLTDKDVEPFMIVPSIDYQVKYPYMDASSFVPGTWAGIIGQINTVIGCSALYVGSDATVSFDSAMVPHYSVTHHVALKASGRSWNEFFDGTEWATIGDVDSSDPPYSTTSFSSLGL